jgi:hypothetical protein
MPLTRRWGRLDDPGPGRSLEESGRWWWVKGRSQLRRDELGAKGPKAHDQLLLPTRVLLQDLGEVEDDGFFQGLGHYDHRQS